MLALCVGVSMVNETKINCSHMHNINARQEPSPNAN